MEEWYGLSEALENPMRSVNHIETAVTATETGGQLADILSVTLAYYPYFDSYSGTVENLPAGFFILTGIYAGRGTMVGMPGANERVFNQVNKILGFPGRFVTATQHENILTELFGFLPEYKHADMKFFDDANNAKYNADFSVYLYPKAPPLPYEPILLDWQETGENYTCLIIFVQIADENENSFYTADGHILARWEIYENATLPENLGGYSCYEVLLEKNEDFPPVVKSVEKFN